MKKFELREKNLKIKYEKIWIQRKNFKNKIKRQDEKNRPYIRRNPVQFLKFKILLHLCSTFCCLCLPSLYQNTAFIAPSRMKRRLFLIRERAVRRIRHFSLKVLSAPDGAPMFSAPPGRWQTAFRPHPTDGISWIQDLF